MKAAVNGFRMPTAARPMPTTSTTIVPALRLQRPDPRQLFVGQQVGLHPADPERTGHSVSYRLGVARQKNGAQTHATERLDRTLGLGPHGVGHGDRAQQPAVTGDEDFGRRLNAYDET